MKKRVLFRSIMHSLLINFFNLIAIVNGDKVENETMKLESSSNLSSWFEFLFPRRNNRCFLTHFKLREWMDGRVDKSNERSNPNSRIQSVIFFWGKKIKSDLILSLLFFFFFFFHDKKSRTNNSWNILKQKIERENFEKENARGEGKRNGKIHGSRFFSERSPVIVFRPRSKRQRQYGKVGTNSPVFSPPVKGGGRKGASIKGATQRKQRRPR